jgi:hypothetical protein
MTGLKILFSLILLAVTTIAIAICVLIQLFRLPPSATFEDLLWRGDGRS